MSPSTRMSRRQSCNQTSPLERLIGRSLAAIVHPIAAWRVYSKQRRALLLLGYSAIGYVAVLSALLAL
jgi:hypothetical protein